MLGYHFFAKILSTRYSRYLFQPWFISLLGVGFRIFLVLFFSFLLPLLGFAAQIKLAWDPNTEPDLAGYKVYYGPASGMYGSPIDVANVTTYTLTGLTQGQTYYAAVKAYDRSNNESGYSNEVSGIALEVTQTFTVTTSPSGLQISVDGATYSAPRTFSWEVGSSHSLSVSSPQAGAAGTRYVYSSWSDGGAQSHTITAPSSSTTYTANFTTQYTLTSGVTPLGGGTVSPSGTNWYNSGQTISISATPNSDYTFGGWSGDLSGVNNPASVTMNGPKNITAQFSAIQETISTPAPPTGPSNGIVGTSYSYIASGASSNLGHSLEFQFDWKGDGTDLSMWGAANQQKTWTILGQYTVRARARCSLHPSVLSNWSTGIPVDIQGIYQITCLDGGIECLERTDGGRDSDNLVNGKPKVDMEYEFRVVVQASGGTPQYVKLFMTQRNNPVETDFYDYDMSCSGDYQRGADCLYRTMLGPAAVHKFYFQAMMSNGTIFTHPTAGYITGPQIQPLKGYSQVGIPRDINRANLDGQGALGSSRVYRWNPNGEYYSKVTASEPAKAGEGYLLYTRSKTLPELGNYGDIPGLEYAYPLKPGMNLISNPYAGNVRFSEVKIKKGDQTPISWQEAATRGWVVNALYYYNGKSWGDTYAHVTPEDGAKLVPWLGYWVNLNAADDIYYLVIPRP